MKPFFFKGLVTAPGPGRLVFLGEEIFPLGEGFIITAKLARVLPFKVAPLFYLSYTCTLGTRTPIQLLGHDRVITEVSSNSVLP